MLYQSLVNQRVTFPAENIFINSSPLNPGNGHRPPSSVTALRARGRSQPANNRQQSPELNGLPVSRSPSNQPSPVARNIPPPVVDSSQVQADPEVANSIRSTSIPQKPLSPPAPAAPVATLYQELQRDRRLARRRDFHAKRVRGHGHENT